MQITVQAKTKTIHLFGIYLWRVMTDVTSRFHNEFFFKILIVRSVPIKQEKFM